MIRYYTYLALSCIFRLGTIVTCLLGVFYVLSLEHFNIREYLVNLDYEKMSAIGTIFGAIATFSAVFIAFYFNNKQYAISQKQTQAMLLQLNEMQHQLSHSRYNLEEVKKQTRILQEDLQISKRAELKMLFTHNNITKKDVENIANALKLISSQLVQLTAAIKSTKR